MCHTTSYCQIILSIVCIMLSVFHWSIVRFPMIMSSFIFLVYGIIYFIIIYNITYHHIIFYMHYIYKMMLSHRPLLQEGAGFILVLIGGAGSFTDAGFLLAYRVSLLAIIQLLSLFGSNPQDTRVLTKC